MLKKLLLATAATAALSTAAMAADIPVDVPAAIPAPLVYNWTGFYAGVNLGYTWAAGDAGWGGNWGLLGFGGIAPGTPGLEPSGVIGGGQLGYNVQFGQFVLGAEADFMFADASDNATFVGNVGAGGFVANVSSRLNWLSTIRGRAGFAFDRFLVYATAGFAFGDVDASASVFGTGPVLGALSWSGSTSSTRSGWTVGIGAEWAFAANMTARLEYLYYDLGTVNVGIPGATAAAIATGFVPTTRHDIDGHLVRAAVNFRF